MSTQKLSEVATVIMGLSPKSENVSRDPSVGLPLLNGPTEFGHRVPVAKQWTSKPARLAKQDDILFCVRGSTTGRMNRAQEAYAIGRGIAAIRGGSRSDTEFIFHALTAGLRRLLALTSGSVFPNLSRADICDFEIEWPDPKVREVIAATLGALDDKIESNRRAINFLGELFNAEFSRTLESTETISTRPLNAIATITKGRSYKSAELQDSPVALVTLKSIDRNGGYKHDGLKPYIGPYKPEQIVSPGEIVVAQTDLTQGAEVVGRGVRVPASGNHDILVASLDLSILRPKDGMPNEYLLGLLSSEAFRQHCRSRVTGTTVLHLAKDAMPTWLAPVVSPEKQEDFAATARALLSRMDAYTTENNRLTSTRDALLPELLSGRVRVTTEGA